MPAPADHPTDIIVVGAGLGGLTCALALLRAGLKVKVLEQAPVLGEVGAGITVSPNSARVFDHLGLSEALEPHIYTPERQWTQNLLTDEVLIDKERGPDVARQYGAGYYHIHRADLHAVLVEAVREVAPDALLLSSPVQRVTSSVDAAAAVLADGTTHEAGLVIGADGLKSVVRDNLFETSPPQFTGQVCWRGLVPAENLPEPLRARPPGIHIGPKRLVMRYPVRGGSLLNYAVFVSLDWRQEGWTIRSTVDELLGHLEDACPAVRDMISTTPPDELYKWALHARDPLDSWISGRVTLLGDAAHAMLPFMGQGAATAIEDGMVLARALSGYPVDEALQRYESARLSRTTMVQTNSRLLGLQFQGKDPASFGAGPIQNEESLGLFSYDAVTTPL